MDLEWLFMPDTMWSLADFRFGEAIEAAEVYVDRGRPGADATR
jgi:hypothetical protein